MSVNVNVKKVVIVVGVLVIVGFGLWWFNSTKDIRAAEAEYEQLVRFADRQAVEIAIIEQSSKLKNYKLQIAENQRALEEKLSRTVTSSLPAPVIIKE